MLYHDKLCSWIAKDPAGSIIPPKVFFLAIFPTTTCLASFPLLVNPAAGMDLLGGAT